MVDRDDDDPLTVELATLRAAVTQFQVEGFFFLYCCPED